MERDEERPGVGSEEEGRPGEPAEAAAAGERKEAPGAGEAAQPAAAGAESAAGGEAAEAPAERVAAPAAEGEPTKAQVLGPGPELAVVLSAAMLLVAAAFFIAGFAAHALLDDDDGGGTDSRGGDGAPASAADDDPAWGPEDALVTIEEFSDFQCPFCRKFFMETLPKIREAYGDKVRFIYRDYPITGIHEFAQKAAEAGQCAHEQGLFWEYHDLLFANQSALAVSDLKRYAQQVGADTGEFNECLDSGRNAREVLLDIQDGNRAGVSGTPAFLINGLLVPGAQPFEQFQRIIDQALAAAGG